MYSDESLNCTDCNQSFTFTAGEQEFFAQKGFTNKPNRCPDCRAARKASGQGGRGGSAFGSRPPREMFTARCSQCGGEAKVPFQPSGDKPVYCRECFQTRQTSRRY
jgi:CxxC-x17-CxxC domain-containing protein